MWKVLACLDTMLSQHRNKVEQQNQVQPVNTGLPGKWPLNRWMCVFSPSAIKLHRKVLFVRCCTLDQKRLLRWGWRVGPPRGGGRGKGREPTVWIMIIHAQTPRWLVDVGQHASRTRPAHELCLQTIKPQSWRHNRSPGCRSTPPVWRTARAPSGDDGRTNPEEEGRGEGGSDEGPPGCRRRENRVAPRRRRRRRPTRAHLFSDDPPWDRSRAGSPEGKFLLGSSELWPTTPAFWVLNALGQSSKSPERCRIFVIALTPNYRTFFVWLRRW